MKSYLDLLKLNKSGVEIINPEDQNLPPVFKIRESDEVQEVLKPEEEEDVIRNLEEEAKQASEMMKHCVGMLQSIPTLIKSFEEF